MKHIKIFEDFSMGDNFKAISVFPEGGSDLYVGVFPSGQADQIYADLMSANKGSLIEILDIPHYHDVVFSELGGEGLSSANAKDYESKTGQPLPELVQLGKSYNFDDDYHIGFLVSKGLNQFIGVNGVGQTFPVSVNKMIDVVKGGA